MIRNLKAVSGKTLSGKTLTIDFAALLEFTDRTGKEMLQAFAPGVSDEERMKLVRDVYFVCLKAEHPEITEQEAINELGADWTGEHFVIGELVAEAYRPLIEKTASAMGNDQAGKSVKKPRPKAK